MKKITAIFALFLVALGGLTTVQAQTYTNESIIIEAFHDDMTENETSRNLDGTTEDFYEVDQVNTETWDTLEDLRLFSHTSLGDEYVDLYDGVDFIAEYYDLVFSSNYDTMEIKEMSGAQDEEYSALVVTDENGDDRIYLVLDLQTDDILMNKDAIDGDQGHEKTTLVMFQGLTGYEAGYNDGYTDAESEKEPASASLDGQNLIVESQDGTEYDFGSSVYNEAYQDGYDAGEGGDFGQGWIMSLFSAFGQIFAIELLPGMTIGLLVGITLVPSVVLVFLKLFRG